MRLNLEEPWALEADKFRLKLAFDCWQGQKDIDVEGWGCWGGCGSDQMVQWF